MGNLRSIPLWWVKRGNHALTGLVIALGAVSSIALPAQAGDVANVDDARIIENAKTGKEWPSNGLDYAVNRFSPLDQITAANVGKLGLAWSYPWNSIRGVEATPIVVDGIMYVTAPWAIVYAINAKTGEKIWTFDSQSPRNKGYKLCCDVVNRGVAVYKGKVYVGTPDSRLIALDAATGKVLWSTERESRECPSLHNHRGAARGQRQGFHRRRRRGLWRSRRSQRIRRRNRQARMALVHCAGRSFQAIRERSDGQGGEDLGRHVPLLGEWRRRDGVEHVVRGPQPEPPLFRHRQRRPLGVLDPQSLGQRQSLHVFGGRAGPRHGQIRVALPGDTRETLGTTTPIRI